MKTLRRSAALLAIPALLSLTGCGGTPSVAQSDVEEKISSGLEEQVGQKPDDISCPDDLEGEVGTTMTCTLTAGGDQLDVAVEVTEVDGDNVKFSFEVAQMDDGSSS